MTGTRLRRAAAITAAMFSRTRFSLIPGVIFTRSFWTSSTSTAARRASMRLFMSLLPSVLHFILMPALWMTRAHSAFSSAISFANASGVELAPSTAS